MIASGRLAERPIRELLAELRNAGGTGFLRLLQPGRVRHPRAEIAFRGSRVVGAALYRPLGQTGTGEALVDEALCSPEESQLAVQLAVAHGMPAHGALAEGAMRAQVDYGRVVEALSRHVRAVVEAIGRFENASFELHTAFDAACAPAIAFTLDDGLDPVALGLGSLDSTPDRPVPPVLVARRPEPAAADPSRGPIAAPPPPAAALFVEIEPAAGSSSPDRTTTASRREADDTPLFEAWAPAPSRPTAHLEPVELAPLNAALGQTPSASPIFEPPVVPVAPAVAAIEPPRTAALPPLEFLRRSRPVGAPDEPTSRSPRSTAGFVVPDSPAALPTAAAPAGARREQRLRETLAALGSRLEREEILQRVLGFAGELFGRGLLLMPSAEGELVGFSAFGIDFGTEDPDVALRAIRVPFLAHPAVQRALAAGRPDRSRPGTDPWERHLLDRLGGGTPLESFVGTISRGAITVAVLYGDMLPMSAPVPATHDLEHVLAEAGRALLRGGPESPVDPSHGPTG